ncbi:MAG: 3-methyl-2-oxobutanoate dehydrogenase subunit VorB [Candidatus Woesearchaeota archaeon]|jgi:2-oxoglutarate ferredoxin oxidoreductase subunit alpha|nr:3-methyl-2-oxobutanoate dehydrogenase subunit VorB [Candidatus Woesearchaeota archaeon]MDP7457367.1 3-methyl-2-oxobutanoate dehydrogenase subunit VorB [Candidatus Woesearchaeota archaeon]
MTEKALMKGNESCVEAALRAGCKFYAGYPITPQNEIPEYMSKRGPDFDAVFIQAEAELSAINMIFGASASGVRCMTSSSSPGISLKQEGISYLASAELPCVIVNMVRGGPGLGNIRASQGDYFQSTKGGGHGDYKLIVLAPSNIQELYDLTMNAFDYADYYRNPVLILGDGILAQMAEPVELRNYKPILDLPSKDSWVLNGCEGREPHVIKTLLLSPPDSLVKHNIHLQEKYGKIKDELSLCNEYMTDDADIIIAAYGSPARISRESVDDLRKEGVKIGLVQPISLWPFPEKVFSKYKGKKVLVVEMSEGQLIEDVKLSMDCEGEFYFLGHGGGWYPDTKQIIEKVHEIK